MIKKANDRNVETRQNMRDGSGEITIKHYLNSSEMQDNCRLCSEVIIPPGASIGLHEHSNEEEMYLVQKGTGIVQDDDITHTVTIGDSVLTGNGGTHNIKNESTEDLIIIALITKY